MISLSSNDLEYYKDQNMIFSEKLESYFDNENPGYHSIERKNALFLTDALAHYPFPHDDSIKEMFLNRAKKALDSIRETKVEKGVVIWNIYNMSYIVKSKDITIAFDLIRFTPSLIKKGDEDLHKNLIKNIVDLSDVLFLSHNHDDHADPFVAKEFLSQNKPVIANTDIFSQEDFFSKITHWPTDGEERKFMVPNINTQISLRIYPGHQAIEPEVAIDNNFTVITLPDNITIAHSGDQCWNDDFTWIDSVHKDVDIDLLMINTWTLCPDRLAAGIKPNIILPGHINEMSHEIISRIPFWKSYSNWKNVENKVVHLFWAEPYNYERTKDN